MCLSVFKLRFRVVAWRDVLGLVSDGCGGVAVPYYGLVLRFTLRTNWLPQNGANLA
jgi:hypothetical protein